VASVFPEVRRKALSPSARLLLRLQCLAGGVRPAAAIHTGSAFGRKWRAHQRLIS
jgi:hypothetical protein